MNDGPARLKRIPNLVRPRLYTQVSLRDRRSGKDAGIQAQGGETSCYPNTCRTAKLPSMALDTGIPAGMTTLKHTGV